MNHTVTAAMMVAALFVTGAVRAEGGDAQASTQPVRIERPAHFKLVNSAPSVDALAARVLDALAKKDAGALRRLRVTETEYRTFIIPGSVKPGESPQILDDEASQYAWSMLNTNSEYAVRNMISKYGGQKYRLKGTEFAKGQKEYAWYQAYKVVVLTLEDEKGMESAITLGSVADVDGQFKFISLLGDL